MQLLELIDNWSINKALLAFKMNMPKGTFNNKLSAAHSTQFSADEKKKLIGILRDMSSDIHAALFNESLAVIARQEG